MDLNYNELKELLKDRLKVAYVCVGAIVAILAFLLLYMLDWKGYEGTVNYYAVQTKNLGLVKQVSEYKKYIDEMNKQYVASQKDDWLIKYVSNNAKTSYVILDLVQPLDSSYSPGYEIKRVLVEGKAFYDDIGNFLDQIENAPRFIKISEFFLEAEEINAKEKSIDTIFSRAYKLKKISGEDMADYGLSPSAGNQITPEAAQIANVLNKLSGKRMAKFSMILKSYNQN